MTQKIDNKVFKDRDGIGMHVRFYENKITVRYYKKPYTECECVTSVTGKPVTVRSF